MMRRGRKEEGEEEEGTRPQVHTTYMSNSDGSEMWGASLVLLSLSLCFISKRERVIEREKTSERK